MSALATMLVLGLSCGAPFTDHAVLQRDRPVAIWGEAAPGEKVSVSFHDARISVTAGLAGSWRAVLPPQSATATPSVLTIRSASQTLAFDDVLVGEVWLCSGQSNMEKPLGPIHGQQPTDHYEQAIAASADPLLRLFLMPHYGRNPAGWQRCGPATLTNPPFSAIGYYFGHDLREALRVPVGIIASSFGGTQIEAWIPDYRAPPYPAYVPGVQASELYTSMIAPLVPCSIRGFLWYQGESNVMEADTGGYTDKMRLLIGRWRRAFQAPDAPFYYVQLAPFDYSRWDKFPKKVTPLELPRFWEAQTAALSIPHTGMVVTTDLVANFHDIHPTDKRDVARRLAGLALSGTYGETSLLARSPRFVSFKRRARGRIVLRFADAGSGLRSRDGLPLTDFALAGADRQFVAASVPIADVQGSSVTVSSPQVPNPVAVRFAWSETAHPNLVNSAGLPAIPFRTDNWPVPTVRAP